MIRFISLRRLAPIFTLLLTSPVLALSQRPMTVDDLFTIEQIGQIAPSPDGEWLAVVIKRVRSSAETYKKDFLWENDHADVWLISRRGSERRNLTNGRTDGSGYWNPTWSPDGQRLALLSTRGGDNVRLFLWEKASGQIKRLTERGVPLHPPTLGFGGYNSIIWTDDTHLLCPVLPPGQQPFQFWLENRTPQIASREWPKVARGLESTASEIESGVPPQKRDEGELLLIDARSGATRAVAGGNFSSIIPAPDGRHFALTAVTSADPPRPDQLLRVGRNHTSLAVLTLDGTTASFRWIAGVFDPSPSSSGVPHTWSPDSSHLGVIAKASPDQEQALTLFSVAAQSGEARKLIPAEWEASAVVWTAGSKPVVYARPVKTGVAKQQSRFDWYLLNPLRPEVPPRNLTSAMKAPPALLLLTSEPNRMVGLSGGELYLVNIASGESRALLDSSIPKYDAIVWPKEDERNGRALSHLIVQATAGGRRDFYLLDLSATALKPVLLPSISPGATLVTYLPSNKSAVLQAVTPEGSFVWLADGESGRAVKLLSLNEHLTQIAEAKRVLIEYRGGDGEPLKALVLLPLGYREGTRYPLIVWQYPGMIVRDLNHREAAKNTPSFLNLQLLTAHGYAVLIPSIPLRAAGEANDPYLETSRGVLPAVDKVIELGIADASRLGVMGHSYGGYGTYILVTATTRFKAAVALAGISDLVSLYGSFDARHRYLENAHEALLMATQIETGQIRGSLWSETARYLRNSPVFYLDRVRTPLMIVQGDLDYVSLQQGEEFFTGLYRLGKRAKFVRYWGEGHVLESPANIRDMWQRVFAWFDELLKSEKE